MKNIEKTEYVGTSNVLILKDAKGVFYAQGMRNCHLFSGVPSGGIVKLDKSGNIIKRVRLSKKERRKAVLDE